MPLTKEEEEAMFGDLGFGAAPHSEGAMCKEASSKPRPEGWCRGISPLVNNGNLLCPVCRGQFIHQATVCVRRGDSNVLIANGEIFAQVEEDPEDWSENRRGCTVSIDFWCEACPPTAQKYRLVISNQKGLTYLDWYERASNVQTPSAE